KRLMIRNPKDFGVWSACPSGVHSVITKLEMLPTKFYPVSTEYPSLTIIPSPEELNPESSSPVRGGHVLSSLALLQGFLQRKKFRALVDLCKPR
ncbi:MAG: hypothetical protein Q8P64_17465, partial [Deltaproteobacteria bacterium]|nr:hypothetical protein [Deltaproteobacteria bacterium]